MPRRDPKTFRDYPCTHLKYGKCTIGGKPCIRWDQAGRLRDDITFSDCENYAVAGDCKHL